MTDSESGSTRHGTCRGALAGRALATALLALGLAGSAAAAGFGTAPGCPVGMTVARIDTRGCPAEARRAAGVTRRACCRGQDGRLRCNAFPHCPGRSPS